MRRVETQPLAVNAVPIDDLRPDPANPRRISEDELGTLERSLRRFGFVQPVLARREDQTVIGGHQRLVAARRLGLTSVPVTWLDVSMEQARLLGLALNKISGSWDDALLARRAPASTEERFSLYSDKVMTCADCSQDFVFVVFVCRRLPRPTSPRCTIRRAMRFLPTRIPPRRRAAVMRGAP